MKKRILLICTVLVLLNTVSLFSQNTGASENTWYKINARGKFVTKIHASGEYSQHDLVVHIINFYYKTAEVTYISEFNYNHKRIKLEWGYTGNNADHYMVVRVVPVTATYASSFTLQDISDPSFDYGLTAIDASLVTPIKPQNRLFVDEWNGRVGIGTTSPDAKLTVKGKIHTEEIKVDLSVPAPDYVFEEGYELRTLAETQKYIDENGHLPNIPSAKELEANGIELGEMNMKLLEKIEELTVYVIQLKEENSKIQPLQVKLKSQETRIEEIEKKLLQN